KQVWVAAQTTFTLTASNTTGSAQATTTVTVQAAAPVINTFTASPTSVPSGGGYVTFSWNTANATSLSLHTPSNTTSTVTGSTSTQLYVTTGGTFTLTASNGSTSVTATTNVTVQAGAPVINTFSAN